MKVPLTLRLPTNSTSTLITTTPAKSSDPRLGKREFRSVNTGGIGDETPAAGLVSVISGGGGLGMQPRRLAW